jgi:5-formyltetrahydrofolate cyclo-ligase
VTSTPADPAHARRAKSELRAALLAARANRPNPERTAVSTALARAFEAAFGDRFRGATPRPVIATYLSVGSEPDTAHLNAGLTELGVTTLAPVLTDDGDLDWAAATTENRATEPHSGAEQFGLRGTREPTSPRLGRDAITSADLVLVPALAVDRAGHRLGRGGGSYDRALTRVQVTAVVLAVVHDDEVLDAVPFELHDRIVDGALTPSGVRYFGTAADG